MQTVDAIIIGQGVAGTLMAYKLWKEQRSFVVIDDDQAYSSRIASGIINPVTGRRFVKSWRIEELLALADEIYPALSQLLDIPVYKPIQISRKLSHHQELETWEIRADDPAYQVLYPDIQTLGNGEDAEHYGQISQARLVFANLLIETFRNWLSEQRCLVHEQFDYQQLRVGQILQYKSFSAAHIVFCEGWKIRSNPFFNTLPIIPTKGERLLISTQLALPHEVLKDELYLLSLGHRTYWVGPTNEWNAADDQASKAKLDQMSTFLDARQISYKVLDHAAAFRPAAHDRRPVVGTHPIYQNLHVINGLGTKGFSLAPYCAKALYEHIFRQKTLDSEMDWRRFMRKAEFQMPNDDRNINI